MTDAAGLASTTWAEGGGGGEEEGWTVLVVCGVVSPWPPGEVEAVVVEAGAALESAGLAPTGTVPLALVGGTAELVAAAAAVAATMRAATALLLPESLAACISRTACAWLHTW